MYHMDRGLLVGVLLTAAMFMTFLLMIRYAVRKQPPIKPEPLEEQDHQDALDDREGGDCHGK